MAYILEQYVFMIRTLLETPLHCTVSAIGIIGPVFLTDAVTPEQYCEVHAENFILILQGTGVQLKETFF
jgi:hypothetical protein